MSKIFPSTKSSQLSAAPVNDLRQVLTKSVSHVSTQA